VTAFSLSLAEVAGVLAVAAAAGFTASSALMPRGRAFLAERIGWSFALGCALLAVAVPIAFLFGASAGWAPFLLGGALVAALARLLPLPAGEGRGEGKTEAATSERAPKWVFGSLVGLLLLGVALYALRALTEPMWSNDFLAIWGLKGKTIFFSRGVPSRLYDWRPLSFSHPEYPLGLPFLYAGVSFLTGSWDDHAMALLFPFFQVATLCTLVGWLRRRGAPNGVALCAAALVALFEPLYSAFLTGMAEVPLAFGLLLFGTALADSLDEAGSGPLRRLAFASFFMSSVKNEGLFLAAAGFAMALLFGGARRLKVALAAVVPALAVYGLHSAWRGRAPLLDLDFTLFSSARVVEAVGAAARIMDPFGWVGLCAVALLIAAGARDPAGERLLLLAAFGLTAYLALPVFAVRGPAWLVDTTLQRTVSALVPLVGAGLAVRLMDRRAAPE
jgi:hypothetical protein